jgi:hypothetical protein
MRKIRVVAPSLEKFFMVIKTSPKRRRKPNTSGMVRACQVTPACQSIYEGTQSARTMPSLRAALLQFWKEAS